MIYSKTITSQSQSVLAYLGMHGAASSVQIQRALQVSQPSVSRLLSLLEDDIVVLGRGRSTQYAVAQPIGTAPAQQPIWLIDAGGLARQIGTLSYLAKSQIYVAGEGLSAVFEPDAESLLPWYLSPLRAKGFLGRVLAQRLSGLGIPPNPESWDSHAALTAALHTHDAPGALLLGHGASGVIPSNSDMAAMAFETMLDEMAQDVAKTLPLGSSAGGEQPKFTAINPQNEPVLIKFSPPLGTPFGDRWNDLLRAEVLCNDVLRDHGFQVADTEILQTSIRTYLISKRFDRVGRLGRRHIVSLGAAHHAFVKGAYINWPASGDALARQGRLKRADAAHLHELFQFGKLIGNTDMHSGNAGLFVQGQFLNEIAAGLFLLAPVYDMLPMRWKPDPMLGAFDYEPFELDLTLASKSARAAAKTFWLLLAKDPRVSNSLNKVASAMAERIG